MRCMNLISRAFLATSTRLVPKTNFIKRGKVVRYRETGKKGLNLPEKLELNLVLWLQEVPKKVPKKHETFRLP